MNSPGRKCEENVKIPQEPLHSTISYDTIYLQGKKEKGKKMNVFFGEAHFYGENVTSVINFDGRYSKDKVKEISKEIGKILNCDKIILFDEDDYEGEDII